MKKKYQQPNIQVIRCMNTAYIMAGSGNNIYGTIHSGGSGETIGAGDEDDDGGMEASSKKNLFDYEW